VALATEGLRATVFDRAYRSGEICVDMNVRETLLCRHHHHKELQLNASLYTRLQILSVSVFEKTWISCALQRPLFSPILPATLSS
jgi:hypothetical protein